MTPKLNWHDQRQHWNNDGQCAREACRAPLPSPAWFNSGSRLFYCEDCARKINQYNPGLCTLPEQENR